ncbi:MAG: TIGR02117 family protein, partial [Flavobacterium sp.]|nr:TIGR02117 family protein [Flavobacterium sp.]
MKIIKKILKYTAIFVLSLMTYLLIVTLLSFVSVNEDVAENQGEIPFYILTNGVHTDIVLPIKNEHHDWSTQLKFEHTKSKDTTYQYVALGWGDKGFYLETPTWADLKASTAVKAATGLSSSAMHVTFYKHLKENQSCKKIQISLENYNKLIAFINESFQTKSGEFLKIETNAVYGKHDVFYEANGSYSLFYTCNSWANQALKSANQKAAL